MLKIDDPFILISIMDGDGVGEDYRVITMQLAPHSFRSLLIIAGAIKESLVADNENQSRLDHYSLWDRALILRRESGFWQAIEDALYAGIIEEDGEGDWVVSIKAQLVLEDRFSRIPTSGPSSPPTLSTQVSCEEAQ